MKQFDKKFGEHFLGGLPQSPAVYLFVDAGGEVLYVGKAKNIRRRLSNYRSASRRKVHRKMRTLVREAASIDVRLQASESQALLVENELIREFRPRYNVDGAFDFLYPAIGSGDDDGRLVLCFTSEPEVFEGLNLQWHGSFRPRRRAREAFDTLLDLFGRIGHLEPRNRLPEAPHRRGARVAAVRRLPDALLPQLRSFLDGDDKLLLGTLFTLLLESQEARRQSVEVEDALRFLEDFYIADVMRLRDARLADARSQPFVHRSERDALFIRARSGAAQTRGA